MEDVVRVARHLSAGLSDLVVRHSMRISVSLQNVAADSELRLVVKNRRRRKLHEVPSHPAALAAS